MAVAYPDLPFEHKNILMQETFTNALGHTKMQTHLLMMPTPTLANAIRAGNVYLQIQSLFPSSSQIRQIGEDKEDSSDNPQAQNDQMANISKVLQKLVTEMDELQANQPRQIKKTDRKKVVMKAPPMWRVWTERSHPQELSTSLIEHLKFSKRRVKKQRNPQQLDGLPAA